MEIAKIAVVQFLLIGACIFSIDALAEDCKTVLIGTECAPPPHTAGGTISDSMRIGLYYRCRGIEGGTPASSPTQSKGDEYTNNCCDHLTADLQKSQKVCGFRPDSGLFGLF